MATIYGLWLVYAAGLEYLLMCAILFAPGIVVFWLAKREHGEPVFKGFEWLIAIGSLPRRLPAISSDGTISPF